MLPPSECPSVCFCLTSVSTTLFLCLLCLLPQQGSFFFSQGLVFTVFICFFHLFSWGKRTGTTTPGAMFWFRDGWWATLVTWRKMQPVAAEMASWERGSQTTNHDHQMASVFLSHYTAQHTVYLLNNEKLKQKKLAIACLSQEKLLFFFTHFTRCSPSNFWKIFALPVRITGTVQDVEWWKPSKAQSGIWRWFEGHFQA